jgi:ribulose-phosphate 3-epimerase
VAINPATPVEAILAVVDAIDVALVMTVNPGWGGQAFIESCLEKVRRIRAAAPQIDIEVDGGIDPMTLRVAKAAGANVFVSGSYLAKAPSIREGVQELRAACA